MKNKSLNLSENWTVNRDEFYSMDKSAYSDTVYTNLYVQEDLLSISNAQYNIDLGWYGGEDGCFCLYLYRGDDWNSCELLEKQQTKEIVDIIAKINSIAEKVDNGTYAEVKNNIASIDNYSNYQQYSIFNKQ